MAKHTTKYLWWGYAKNVIRAYKEHIKDSENDRLNRFERNAVQQAIEQTKLIRNGAERLQMVDMVFWKQSHTLDGVALKLYFSRKTVERWHRDFIYLVGVEMGLCRE